ncbi:MAG: BamA/OMP85 family outer membrane protein [Candidatus Muiribacteriota bacterium]
MKKNYVLIIISFIYFFANAYTINEINLVGNELIMDSVIELSISAREGTEVDESEIDSFSEKIKEEIMGIGYFGNASVVIVPVSRDKANLNIQVLEFPIIQEIILDGETEILDRKEIISNMSTKEGEILNIIDFRKDLEKLREYFHHQGIVLGGKSAINLSEEFDKVIISVYRAKIEDIKISGNSKSEDNVVKRELEFEVGESYDFSELELSYRNLANTGYFKNVDFKPEPTSEGDVIINVEVEEEETGQFRFGGTYGSEQGLTGLIEVEDKNFRGKGYSLNIKAEFGGYDNYEIGYYNPRYKDRRVSHGINIYDTRYQRDKYINGVFDQQYTEKKKGFNVSWGKDLSRYTEIGLRFYNENITISPDDIGIDDKNSQTLGLSISKDLRDNVFYPTAGYYTTGWLEYTGGFLKGDDEYLKYTGDYRKFYSVKTDFVAAFRLKYSKIDIKSGQVQDYERLSMGGGNSLRGYRLREFVGEENYLGNFEVRYSVSDEFKVSLFYDIGEMDFRDSSKSTGSKRTYGFGFQFKTPLGILRLDWGKPVSGDGSTRNYFNFGPIF